MVSESFGMTHSHVRLRGGQMLAAVCLSVVAAVNTRMLDQ